MLSCITQIDIFHREREIFVLPLNAVSAFRQTNVAEGGGNSDPGPVYY